MNKGFLLAAVILGSLTAGGYLIITFFLWQYVVIVQMHDTSIVYYVLLISAVIVSILSALQIMAIIQIERFRTEKSTNKTATIAWSIFLIFSSLWSGILALIGLSTSSQTSQNRETALEEKLAALNHLYESGLINNEEYNLRRKKILEML